MLMNLQILYRLYFDIKKFRYLCDENLTIIFYYATNKIFLKGCFSIFTSFSA